MLLFYLLAGDLFFIRKFSKSANHGVLFRKSKKIIFRIMFESTNKYKRRAWVNDFKLTAEPRY